MRNTGIIIIAIFVAVVSLLTAKNEENDEVAIFAGGCFWCTQHDFDQVKGVISTTAGYTGGDVENPSYEEVSTGKTGHLEALKVVFDPSKVSYEELLNFYWHNIDPTRNDGQFCDEGNEYRPVIFYSDDSQQKLADDYKAAMIKENKVRPILVDILPAKTFYPAEEYHQKYYKKNPVRYKFYRFNCGRDQRLKEIWGSPVSSRVAISKPVC